jgi:hypothetical protein
VTTERAVTADTEHGALDGPDLLIFEPPHARVDELASQLQHLGKVNCWCNADGLGIEGDLHAAQHRIRQHQPRALFFESFLNYTQKVSRLSCVGFNVGARTL